MQTDKIVTVAGFATQQWKLQYREKGIAGDWKDVLKVEPRPPAASMPT